MDTATYQARRRALRESVPEGAILLPANAEAPRNYEDNPYPFRQDSSFLYYVGIKEPDYVVLLEDDGTEVLYGPPRDPDADVWFGPRPGPEELAGAAGIGRCAEVAELRRRVAAIRGAGGTVHYLPSYRADRRVQLADLMGLAPSHVDGAASSALVRAVVEQRSIKTPAEVAEIEVALTVTADAYRQVMATARPGRTEAEIAAVLQGVALARGMEQAFPPIVTIRGEVLHNTGCANALADGDLLLVDSGAEAPSGYASDITRTMPVAGRFDARQRDVYSVVLAAQEAAIDTAAPGTSNREVHMAAARTIAEGLIDIGLLTGDAESVVAAGAHALFFVHGIGHMLGLDVHDMEDLGDVVGYEEGDGRSEQFGLNFLRLARPLEPGFVITIEPGVYFNPALVDRWEAAGRHRDMIRYERVRSFMGLGGVRIEDDVLITDSGRRVLGPGIPKTVEDVEDAVGR